MTESLSERLLGSTEQAEVINQVVAGVRETFADGGIDQAVLNRLEKLWVSKLMDRQEGAWQPTATTGKSGANLPVNMEGTTKGASTGGRNTGEMSATSKVVSRKGSTTRRGVRERWEQAPKKTTSGGNVGADLKLKKLEVKTKETNSTSAKGAQSKEGRAKMSKKKDGSEEEATEVESIIQLDGNAEHNGSSDDDDELGLDDDSDDEDSDGSDESSEDEGENLGDELGSDDDISDEDASELFDTSNVVVCQYDRISKSRNKWKFNLKNGVMNLDGRDYTFLRATGEAVW